MNLYILIGLPGAGKSTYSASIKSPKKIIISSDEIREKLFGTGFNETIKEEVFKELVHETIEYLKKGMDVIVDTTFLNEKEYRSKFISEIDTLKLSVKKIAVIMQTDIEECILRDKKRIANRRVGSTVIRKLNDVLEFPHENEGFDLLLKIKGQNENYKENFKVPIINV